MEVELLKEDNEQLVTQYEREKVNNKRGLRNHAASWFTQKICH